MDIEDENLKIKIVLKDKNNLLANANITIKTVAFGYVTIKGFQIWKSNKFNDRLQEPLNVAPPSKQAFGRYIQIVFLEDAKRWYELESRIYGAYLDVRNKSKIEYEDIDPEDLPV